MLKCFKVFYYGLVIVSLIGLPTILQSQEKEKMDKFILFDKETKDVKDWYKGWGVEAGEGDLADIKIVNGEALVEGKVKEQNFAPVHKNITINLDQYPYLFIDVKSVSRNWYLIISGSTVPNGYIKLQEDTDQVGQFKYNVKEKLGLSGEITVDVQVGVSTFSEKSSVGSTVLFKEFYFFNPDGTGKKVQHKIDVKPLKKTEVKSASPVLPEKTDKMNMFILFNKETKDVKDWYKGWGVAQGEGDLADIKIVNSEAVIEGKMKDQSFAPVHKNININLDEYPYLYIDVKSVTRSWYIIISGSTVRDGYFKLQEDTDQVGALKYNVKEKLGLSGEINVDVQIGVSAPNEKGCLGEKVIVKELYFYNPQGSGKKIQHKTEIVPGKEIEKKTKTALIPSDIDKSKYFDMLSDKYYKNISDWYKGWGNTPDEAPLADILIVKGEATITGKMKDQNFGAVHKNITFNIDEYPYIEIEVKSVSQNWYLVVSGKNIQNGYVRVQPDTPDTGYFVYNIKEITGLSGQVNVDIQIGVSNPDSKSSDGSKVVVKKLKLSGIIQKSKKELNLNLKYVDGSLLKKNLS